ncbi:pilin [Amycolatopsis sp. cmx-11-12]|uniref:pilin n=1 Tax=Amycolatopsis sp. cmx-11-12 TaxID=2785795 RepID=UPI0039174295
MRLNDRTTTSGPCSARLDDHPQPPAETTSASAPEETTSSSQPTSTPIITSEDWTPVRRRRWAHMAVIVELAVLALLVSASAAHADTMVLAIAGSVTDVLNNVRNWIMGILAGLATVFLSIGGVRYVVGGGDPGEVEKAKTAFKSAGWGYGLAVLAPLVVEILKGIVGA